MCLLYRSNVMSMSQQETSRTLSQTMLQGIVDAVCDRPGDTAGQRDARARDVVDAVQGFAPRDTVELMFAGLAVIHAQLIQDLRANWYASMTLVSGRERSRRPPRSTGR